MGGILNDLETAEIELSGGGVTYSGASEGISKPDHSIVEKRVRGVWGKKCSVYIYWRTVRKSHINRFFRIPTSTVPVNPALVFGTAGGPGMLFVWSGHGRYEKSSVDRFGVGISPSQSEFRL